MKKTQHVLYFRKAEDARISNMIFSAHHQSIIQRKDKDKDEDKDKVQKILDMWHIFEKQGVQGYQI